MSERYIRDLQYFLAPDCIEDIINQRKDIYIEHWDGKAARRASWKKMNQPGEFCW